MVLRATEDNRRCASNITLRGYPGFVTCDGLNNPSVELSSDLRRQFRDPKNFGPSEESTRLNRTKGDTHDLGSFVRKVHMYFGEL